MTELLNTHLKILVAIHVTTAAACVIWPQITQIVLCTMALPSMTANSAINYAARQRRASPTTPNNLKEHLKHFNSHTSQFDQRNHDIFEATHPDAPSRLWPNRKPDQSQKKQEFSGTSYTFKTLGTGILATDTAHIVVPIDYVGFDEALLSIEKLLVAITHVSNTNSVREYMKEHGMDTTLDIVTDNIKDDRTALLQKLEDWKILFNSSFHDSPNLNDIVPEEGTTNPFWKSKLSLVTENGIYLRPDNFNHTLNEMINQGRMEMTEQKKKEWTDEIMREFTMEDIQNIVSDKLAIFIDITRANKDCHPDLNNGFGKNQTFNNIFDGFNKTREHAKKSVIDRVFNYYAKQIIQQANCFTKTTEPRYVHEVLNGNPAMVELQPRKVLNGLALVPGPEDDPGPWSPRSLLFLERVFPKLEEEAVLDNINHSTKEITKNYLRTRRGAGIVIGFALTNLFALGTTGYSQAQINQIIQATKSIAGEQKLLVKQFDNANTEIRKNREAVLNNKEKIKTLEKLSQTRNAQVAISYIGQVTNRILRTAHQTVQLYASTVADALDGRLHFGLIKAKDAQNILTQTKKIADQRGLIPATESVSHLHSLPVSIRFHSKGFDLIIHIPLVPIHSLFTLYKHNPFPLDLNNTGIMMTVETSNDILAVNNDPDTPLFVEINEGQLARFTKLGSTYIMTGINIINRHTKPSCLFSLYQNSQKDALKLCQVFVTPSRTALIKINSHELLSYSKINSVYKHFCLTNNRPMWRTPRQLSRIQKVELMDGCLTFFDDMIAYPDSTFNSENGDYSVYEWNVDPLDTLRGMSADAIKIAIAATTMSHRNKIGINEIHATYQELQQKDTRGKILQNQINQHHSTQQILMKQIEALTDIQQSLGGNHTVLDNTLETLRGLVTFNVSTLQEGVNGLQDTLVTTVEGTKGYVDEKVEAIGEYWNSFEGNPAQKVKGILADQASIVAKQVTHSNFFIGLVATGIASLCILVIYCYCNHKRTPKWFKKQYDILCDNHEAEKKLKEANATYNNEKVQLELGQLNKPDSPYNPTNDSSKLYPPMPNN